MINIHHKKFVIFDFDETLSTLLVDWSIWLERLDKLFLKYDPHFSHVSHVGLAEKENIFTKKYGEAWRDELIEMTYSVESQHSKGYLRLPKSLKLLEEVKNMANVYLWTSNDKRTILPILAELGIESYFQQIVTRNDVQFIKPDPNGFELIYRAAGGSKDEYLMVGDSAADRGAAEAAGIEFVHIDRL